MLTHLQIQNFVIITHLELDFNSGLSVITGETGAGKSIIIDALSLILGSRGESAFIGQHGDRCELTAIFDLENVPEATKWLIENDYAGETNECILRRVLHKDGKSRQTINGSPCTLQQLKDFTPTFINIHSQNEQQLLQKRSHQRDLVDSFSDHPNLCNEVKNCYYAWVDNQKKLEHLAALGKNADVQQELLEYQLKEFENLALQENEYETLDQEHKQLANAEALIKNCQSALENLSEMERGSAQDRLYTAQNLLQGIQNLDGKIAAAYELVNHSLIHLEEAIGELHSYLNQIEVNPERLLQTEKRLSRMHEMARKYQTQPQALHNVYQDLREKLREVKEASYQYEQLQQKSASLKETYFKAAKKLHKSRTQAANILNEQITNEIKNLGMPGGTFKVAIQETSDISQHGSDEIEFLVAANPGQSLQPLTKVASGGEISRIALAIYVATAQRKTIPTLVFDEIDVGIGGGTAAVVGRLLRSLSKCAQVLCITHLPQVAAYGHNHLCVQKQSTQNKTTTRIVTLNDQERTEEIARMLGGLTITEKTLAHARELVILEDEL